jgi:hypothetical protein
MRILDPSLRDDAGDRGELARGELECLAVLWQAHADGEQALKLSEIRDRISARRAGGTPTFPALTTISTYLRGLVSKKLVRDVIVEDTIEETPKHGPVRVRGIVSVPPPPRSPRTGYRAALTPGDALRDTLKLLADAYPAAERPTAVVDFARAAGLPERLVKRLEKALAG